ncbi:hypothetical protein D4M24_11830 [Escherichia coli]|nr:hypothetical protein D4M24_11830 [Escherichia coli]
MDAEQFGGQQMTVNYHIRGRIIQVPSNYDPEKRTPRSGDLGCVLRNRHGQQQPGLGACGIC